MFIGEYLTKNMHLFNDSFIITPEILHSIKSELLELEEFKNVTDLTFDLPLNESIPTKMGSYEFKGNLHICHIMLTLQLRDIEGKRCKGVILRHNSSKDDMNFIEDADLNKSIVYY